MQFKIGEIKSDWDIVQFTKTIHYRSQDFVDGDIRDNIEAYDEYELREVLVSELEEPQYYIDVEYVDEYKKMDIDTIPPIILGFYSDKTYLTIDGGHRIAVAKELELKTIKAFVAIKSSEGHPLG